LLPADFDQGSFREGLHLREELVASCGQPKHLRCDDPCRRHHQGVSEPLFDLFHDPRKFPNIERFQEAVIGDRIYFFFVVPTVPENVPIIRISLFPYTHGLLPVSDHNRNEFVIHFIL
jgi:hypothetical protein